MTATVGELFVKITSSGFSAVQSGLDKLKTVAQVVEQRFDKVAKQIEQIGSKARFAFAASTAAITGFVAAADPYGFNLFQGAILRASVQIGSIFLPILDAVTAALNRVTGWLRSLTDEQKDSILHWTEFALIALGGVAVLGKVIGVINGVRAAMLALSAATGLATGGLTWLVAGALAVIGALAGLAVWGDKTGGILGSLWDGLKSLWEGVKNVLMALWEAVKPVFDLLIELAKKLWEAFQATIPAIVAVAKWLGQALVATFNAIGVVVRWFISVVQEAYDIVSSVWETLADIFGGEGGIISEILSSLGDLFKWLADMAQQAFGVIGDALKNLKPLFVSIFNVMKDMILQLVRSFIYLGSIMNDVLHGRFKGSIDRANQAVQEFDRKLQEKRDKRKQDEAGKGGPAAPGGAKHTERHAGQAMAKAEITGIAEVWRKIQTSDMNTPEQQRQMEILETQKKANQSLDKIAQNTTPKGNTYTGGQ